MQSTLMERAMPPIIIHPAAAANMLGYDQHQMRILVENGILDEIRHRAGCDAYYYAHEIIAFCRKRRVETGLREAIEFLLAPEQ